MQRQQIVQAVWSSTAAVFSTMLGLEVEPIEIFADKTSPAMDDGVMSFVGITGTWVGSGILSCSAAFACRLCDLFLLTQVPAVNEEVLDAIGELANMIVGNFKTSAEEEVGPLGLSVPTVVYGRNFTSKSPGSNDWLVMPFRCGEDRFEVRLWFAPASESTLYRHGGSMLQAL